MQRRLAAGGGLAAFIALVLVAGVLLIDPRFGPFGDRQQPSATLLPIGLNGRNVAIDRGWYFVEVAGYRYTFQVPTSGFESSPGRNVLSGSHTDNASDNAALAFLGNPTFVYTDPCHWQGSEQATGKTAADFIAAVAAVGPLNPLQLSDVTIDGRNAKRIRIGPGNAAFEACDQQEIRGYEGRRYSGRWIVDDLTVIDFENGDRAVVIVSYKSGLKPYVFEAFQYMVNSLHIEAVSP